MKNKLCLEKMADAINYFDTSHSFFKNDGTILDENELFAKGLTEDEFPWTLKEFRKLGYKSGRQELYVYDDPDNVAVYTLDDNDKSITIDCENFTIKECFIVVDMIRRHFEAVGAGQFVSFGNNKDETHTLFHEESSVMGGWWKDFHDLYVSRMDSDDKIKQIQILTEDYQTDDEKYYTKDRVIHIVLL